jgi:hypothetical protein
MHALTKYSSIFLTKEPFEKESLCWQTYKKKKQMTNIYKS